MVYKAHMYPPSISAFTLTVICSHSVGPVLCSHSAAYSPLPTFPAHTPLPTFCCSKSFCPHFCCSHSAYIPLFVSNEPFNQTDNKSIIYSNVSFAPAYSPALTNNLRLHQIGRFHNRNPYDCRHRASYGRGNHQHLMAPAFLHHHDSLKP